METRFIATVFFEGFSTLDPYGPIQAFDLTCEPQEDDPSSPNWAKPLYSCLSVGKEIGTVNSGVIRTREDGSTYFNGPATRIDYTFDNCPPIDILLIPGAKDAPYDDEELRAGILKLAERATIVACVCTGSLLLAGTGYLDGKKATTNKSAFNGLTPNYPEVEWNCAPKWVDCVDDNLEGWITSAGVSAGTDMACHLIERLNGEQVIQNTLRSIEYNWDSSPEPDPFDCLCDGSCQD